MEKDVLDSAIDHMQTVMGHCGSALSSEYNSGLLALAASRLLSTANDRISVSKVLQFIQTVIDVPITDLVKNASEPSANDINAVVSALLSRKPQTTPIAMLLSKMCNILGLDGADLAILTSLALYHRDERFRALMINADYYSAYHSFLTPTIVSIVSGVSLGECRIDWHKVAD